MPKQALVPKRGGFSKLGYAGEELRPSSSEYQQLRWVGRMRLECWNGWREGWMGWIDGWVVSWLGRIDGGSWMGLRMRHRAPALNGSARKRANRGISISFRASGWDQGFKCCVSALQLPFQNRGFLGF